jgi:hypothetical protein
MGAPLRARSDRLVRICEPPFVRAPVVPSASPRATIVPHAPVGYPFDELQLGGRTAKTVARTKGGERSGAGKQSSGSECSAYPLQRIT